MTFELPWDDFLATKNMVIRESKTRLFFDSIGLLQFFGKNYEEHCDHDASSKHSTNKTHLTPRIYRTKYHSDTQTRKEEHYTETKHCTSNHWLALKHRNIINSDGK